MNWCGCWCRGWPKDRNRSAKLKTQSCNYNLIPTHWSSHIVIMGPMWYYACMKSAEGTSIFYLFYKPQTISLTFLTAHWHPLVILLGFASSKANCCFANRREKMVSSFEGDFLVKTQRWRPMRRSNQGMSLFWLEYSKVMNGDYLP